MKIDSTFSVSQCLVLRGCAYFSEITDIKELSNSIHTEYDLLKEEIKKLKSMSVIKIAQKDSDSDETGSKTLWEIALSQEEIDEIIRRAEFEYIRRSREEKRDISGRIQFIDEMAKAIDIARKSYEEKTQ